MNTRKLRSIRNYIAGCKDEVIPLYQVDAKLLIELLDMRLKAADRQKRYNESRKDYLHQSPDLDMDYLQETYCATCPLNEL